MSLKNLKEILSEALHLETNITALKEFIRKFYIPRYQIRTPKEHEEIRKKVSKNPSSCKHLKGGARHNPTYYSSDYYKDYNVSLFTFNTGRKRIRCNSCGKKWFDDEPEWAEACKMVESSTNTPASCEIPIWYGKDPSK